MYWWLLQSLKKDWVNKIIKIEEYVWEFIVETLSVDIAEVDLIVFFDVVSSPIRQVQREGRTARKRAGRVVVLASNKAEAEKIEKSSEQVGYKSRFSSFFPCCSHYPSHTVCEHIEST